MKRLPALWILLLGGAAALLAADALDPGPRLEFGRERRATLDPASRARLAALPEALRLTWIADPPARLSSELARSERTVRRALAALAAAAPEKVRAEVLRPREADAATLGRLGVRPVLARRVERDGYSEERAYASLRVACGARPAASLPLASPERARRTIPLVLALVEELTHPTPPLVALDAPPRFRALRERLARHATVREIDLAAGQDPGAADLLVWLEPSGAPPEALAALDRHLEAGGDLVLATSALRAVEGEPAGGEPRVSFTPSGEPLEALLGRFALARRNGLVLDPRGDVRPLAGGEALAPHRVRVTPATQDFRPLGEAPEGPLLFAAATAFEVDGSLAAALGRLVRPVATASPLAVLADPPAQEVSWSELRRTPGRPAGGATLAAWVEPLAGEGGRALVLGASSPLSDEALDDPRYACGRLIDILVRGASAPERRALRRARGDSPAALALLDGGARARWRALVVLLPAALAALFAWAFRRPRTRHGAPLLHRRRAPRRRGGPRAAHALALALFALVGAAAPGALDLTRAGAHRGDPGLAAHLGERLAGHDTRIFLVRSPLDRLPPRLRPFVRLVREELAQLADAVPSLSTLPDRVLLDPRAPAARSLGLAPRTVRAGGEERGATREILCHVVAENEHRRLTLACAQPADRVTTRFRLALLLDGLARGKRPRIALAAGRPRLSPAEAALDYERRGRYPPSGGDRASAAMHALERDGFEVLRVDPEHPVLPPDLDALLWFQPRRDVTPMLDALARHLAAGGRALVAVQTHDVRPRSLERDELRVTFWPRPLFADLDERYLPDLGVRPVPEILCDPLYGTAPLAARVEDPSGEARDELIEVTRPFLVRAVPAARTAAAHWLEGVGDLLLPSPARLALDPQRARAAGLTLSPLQLGSPGAWAWRWKGGALPEEALDPAGEGEARVALGTAPVLAAELEGPFPAPGPPATDVPPPRGRLVVLGFSRPFEDDLLGLPDFDHEGLLRAAAAHLATPEPVAAVLRHRQVEAGLGPVAPRARVAWRLAVGLAAPLLVGLAFALSRRRG